MNFVVTARKWRPQRFDEVVGQEHITSTLKNAIKENRIAHAYLFTGPRGVGKTTTARILAKALNCQNPKDAEPCNECETCRSIRNNQLMDIIEIDGASNRGIDEIRSLREAVKYAPTRGKYKVYIIDEVHMLTKESFNAFLKTLEEPPEHTIFIFATTDAHKVPLTIISRCQRYDFRRIQLDKIKEMLKKISKEEKIEIDDTTLTIIAKKADGALRDAESYFDQVVSYCQGKIDPDTVTHILNLIDEEVYFKLSDAVLNKNFKTVFEVSDIIYQNGWDFIDFIEGLAEHFRNILTVIITNSSDAIESADIFKKRYFDYAGKFDESDLLRLLNFINKSQQELRFSQNQKLKIEIMLSHLIAFEKTATISDIISNINSVPADNQSFKTTANIPSPVQQSKKKVTGGNNFSTSKEKTTVEEIRQAPNKIPADRTETDFDGIINKWNDFVNVVTSEKGLVLAPALEKLKLLSLNGINLHYTIPDELDKNTIEMHQKYLENKSDEFFGIRLKLNFKDSQEIVESKHNKEIPVKKSSGNEYENFIINELGGEKIE